MKSGDSLLCELSNYSAQYRLISRLTAQIEPFMVKSGKGHRLSTKLFLSFLKFVSVLNILCIHDGTKFTMLISGVFKRKQRCHSHNCRALISRNSQELDTLKGMYMSRRVGELP